MEIKWKELKLMIVDDDAFLGEMIWRHLAKNWIDAIYARNWAEAVKIATSEKVDMIIMDLDMPIMWWIDAAKIITKEDPNSVILWFSWIMDERRRSECIKAWMRWAYQKPNQIKEIVEDVKRRVLSS